MDKIQKALKKLSSKEKADVKQILLHLDKGEFDFLHIQKLTGRSDLYRVRKGRIRIIYRKSHSALCILAIERRSEKTYRDY